MEVPNRKGRKSSGEGGKVKTERKENQVGKKGKGREWNKITKGKGKRREREGGKGME